MDDGQTWLLPILIFFWLLDGYLAAVLSAVTHLSDVTLHDRAEDGDKKALMLDKLLHGKGYFLDSLRTLSSFFGSIATALTNWWLYGLSIGWFKALWQEQLSHSAIRLIAILFSLILSAVFYVIFIRKLPGRLGKKHADPFAFKSAAFMKGFTTLFWPLCALIRVISRRIGALFGIDRHAETEQETVTEEDIRLMVDTGGEMGTIEESQREMIENIFEFDDNTAGDVMTHRTDVIAVDRSATVAEVAGQAVETGFSRLPVYEKNVDNIIGVIYVKDLLQLICGDGENLPGNMGSMPIDSYIRPVIYVPESAACRSRFAKFKTTKTHIAVVVDEYGGTAGIVCMEDLLESIVGDIEDEYDEQEEEVKELRKDEYLLDGTIDLADVTELLSVEFPEDEDYDTLGGFIIHTLGLIPDEGTNPFIDFSGWRFTVMNVDDRRIEKVRAARLQEEPSENPEEKDT